MKPVTTPHTNKIFELPGGTRANDLPVEITVDTSGTPCLRSTWELTDAEREAIAGGAPVYLIVWGGGTPPVAIGVEGVDPE